MDQKQAARAEDEPRTASNERSVNSPSDNDGVSSENTTQVGDADVAKQPHQVDDEVSENAIPVATPLTFVDLQALVAPASEQAATTSIDVSAGSGSGTHSIAGVSAELMPGGGALKGAADSQKQGLPGLTSGLKMTDALASPLSPDSGRGADAANLFTSAKFQTTPLDAASQQTTKLSAETALPLRSYATSIDLPVGHREWGDKMAGKLSWLTARGMSVAEIHLTPPDMGPMEVKVKLHHDQATITVHVANPAVRDQLELNSHRLRDMLAEQGVDLAQFDVSDSSQQHSGEQAATGGGQSSGGQSVSDMAANTDTDGNSLNAGHLDLSWNGEIDIFA
jgi:flagellar hook-length control protein FliK